MKNIKALSLTITLLFAFTLNSISADIPAYYSAGTHTGTIKSVKELIKTKLKEKNFQVVGGYYPKGSGSNYVLAFTNKTMKAVALSNKNYGMFASVLRVSLKKVGDKIEVRFINPEYFFRGYNMKSYDVYKTKLSVVSKDIKAVFKSLGNELKPFGGALSASELKKYHYMMGMPYFNEVVLLKEFASFEEGVAMIKKNLTAKKGNTRKVYQLVYTKSKKAVFGVGLLDKSKGEPKFLPIVGEKQISSLPYEIVLIGKKAYMLPGRFRFAFYYPELTMGTFTKIMNTPGDVEEMLKGLTK